MVNVDEINRAFTDENGVILPEHREDFLHTVGRHLASVFPGHGKITYNFADGYKGHKEEIDRRDEKKVKV
jgi:hypothetical protein